MLLQSLYLKRKKKITMTLKAVPFTLVLSTLAFALVNAAPVSSPEQVLRLDIGSLSGNILGGIVGGVIGGVVDGTISGAVDGAVHGESHAVSHVGGALGDLLGKLVQRDDMEGTHGNVVRE
ncbi:hypothetical protein DM01DRAFT_1234259 [Hesseltinella vesiculosa]|uniref:Uncharacterized protein n=1 Tax=Hesseltinella vesiculosa TaxID=101127 RepID=A0A1X2GLL0_9FUNG|nr:hypothetical protein DM01DRAFT_1234259 [Hesseltinella vesiculosa]